MKKPTITVVNNPKVEGNVADFVVCHRVSELPIPYVKAEIQHCSKCNERIWVAHTSPSKIPTLCWNCATPLIAEDDDTRIMITERQRAEVHKYMQLIQKLQKKNEK
jgi:hypothetical protein